MEVVVDFSGPDSIIYSKSQSKLHGLRGRKNEYGYQEATGNDNIKNMC